MGNEGRIHVACVGLGYWGPNLLRVLSSMHECRVVAACDRDAAVRERIELMNPWIRATADYDAILSDRDIDAVVLATPAADHFKHTLRALERGKHVFVEKPLALSTKEAVELARVARRKGRVLMVGHVFVYNAAVRYVRRMIERGELGDLYYVYSQRLNLGRVRKDLDVVWNLAPHDISIFNLWMGCSPIAASGRGITALPHEFADAGFIRLDYPNGVKAHIHVSWLDPNKVRRTTIVGSQKMVIYDDVDVERPIQIFDRGVDFMEDSPRGFGEFKLEIRSGDIHVPKIPGVEPLRVECEQFMECIRSGKESESIAERGAEVVSVLEAISASMDRDGALVPVESVPEVAV